MPRTNQRSTRPSRSALPAVAAACFGLAVWSAGCKDDQVRVYNAPKSPETPPATPATTPAVAAAHPEPAAGPALPANAAAGEERTIEAGGLRARVPAAWNQDTKPRMMREATFIIGDPAKKTEVVITKLGGGPAGGLTENVNRWRGQVGLPPVAEVNESAIRKVKIAGKDAMLFDLAGPEAAPTRRQIQAVIPADGAVYYVKIIGDAALVGEQQAGFERFLTSIEFVK